MRTLYILLLSITFAFLSCSKNKKTVEPSVQPKLSFLDMSKATAIRKWEHTHNDEQSNFHIVDTVDFALSFVNDSTINIFNGVLEYYQTDTVLHSYTFRYFKSEGNSYTTNNLVYYYDNDKVSINLTHGGGSGWDGDYYLTVDEL